MGEKEKLRRWLPVGIGILLLVLTAEGSLYLVTGTNCPIKALFGLPCPGCGMTRAVLSLLRGDVAGAFWMHPLVFLLPVALLLLLLWRRGRRGVLIVGTALLLAVFFVRLRLQPGEPPLDLKRDAPFFSYFKFFLS